MVLISPSLLAQGSIQPKTGVNRQALTELEDKLKRINASIEVTQSRIKNQQQNQFAPDLFFMLAELYQDKSTVLRSLKREKNPNTPEAELDFTQEKQLMAEAAEQYKLIEDRYPDYAAMDRVIYTLALQYKLMGDDSKALEAFKRVTEKFPKSDFTPKALLEIGEIFLQKRDYHFATQQFDKAIELGRQPEMSLALYKKGMALIQLEKWTESLLTFEKVYNVSESESFAPDRYSIVEDALTGSVWPLLELNAAQTMRRPDWSNPLTYYQAHAKDKVRFRKVLARLAQRFDIKKRELESANTYWELFKLSDATSEKKAAFEAAYIKYKNLKKTDFPIWAGAELSNLLLMMKSPVENRRYQNDIPKYEVVLRDVLTSLHSTLLVTKRAEELSILADQYESYLMHYPRSPHTPLMRLNLAESLFHAQEYHRAGRYYLLAATGANHRNLNKQQTLDSALEAYLSGASNLKLPLFELMQSRAGYRTTAAVYQRLYPRDRKIADLQFNVAKIAYDEQNFDQAAKLLFAFISRHPRHAQARGAAMLYLDCYYLRNQMKEMAAAGNRLIQISALPNDLKTEIRQAATQARLKAIRSVAGEFGSQNYAATFAEFARKNKNSQLGEQALFEAYSSLRSQGNSQAFDLGEEYVASYPQTARGKEILLSLTQLALSKFDYTRAGAYLGAYAERYPTDPKSKGFAEQAGLIYEMLGQVPKAIASFKLAGQNTRGLVTAMRWGQWRILAEEASKTQGLPGQYYQGVALYRQGQASSALRLLDAVAKSRGSNSLENEMIGHAAVILAEYHRKNFIRSGRGKPFTPELLQTKSAQYQQISQYASLAIESQGGKWILGGLYNLGVLNLEMSQFLKSSPPPPGISPSQLRQMLTPQIEAYTKTANETLAQCFSVANQNEYPTLYAIGCQSRKVISERQDSDQYPGNPAQSINASVLNTLIQNSANIEILKTTAINLMQSGSPHIALLLLSRAQELSPEDMEILSLQGVCYLHLRHSLVAQTLFQQAIRKNPSEGLALRGLAGIAKQYGYNMKSVSYQRQAAPTKWSGLHPWLPR